MSEATDILKNLNILTEKTPDSDDLSNDEKQELRQSAQRMVDVIRKKTKDPEKKKKWDDTTNQENLATSFYNNMVKMINGELGK